MTRATSPPRVDMAALLARADAGDAAELTVLRDKKAQALNSLEATDGPPTRAALAAYREAAAALDALVDKLHKSYFPEDYERRFKNRVQVLGYLRAQGYKVGKSKLYSDARRGLLQISDDGTIGERAVKAYIRRARLKKPAQMRAADADGTQRPSERLASVKAEREAFKLAVERGEYVRRDAVEREQAELAMVFDAGLRQMLHTRIPEWVRLAGGDPDLVPDAIVQADQDLDGLLRALADASGFEVLVAPAHEEESA